MATQNIVSPLQLPLLGTPIPVATTTSSAIGITPPANGPGTSVLVAQRIYDSVLGAHVYYTSAINPAPLAGDTTPNHTGNLVASTHEVL